MSSLRFDSEGLLTEAAERARCDTMPPDPFLDGFETLTSAFASQPFTVFGRRLAQSELLRIATERLRLDRLARPKVPRSRVEPQVVVIVGLPRTCTTLLHHLLAQDPTVTAPRLAWALHPSQPEDVALELADRHLAVIDGLSPRLRELHPMSASGPEECTSLLALAGASERWLYSLDSSEYASWLSALDLTSHFVWYRELLLATFPDASHLVLKAPSHLGAMSLIASTFPRARFIWTHRDPGQALASFCDLVVAARQVFCEVDRIDRAAIGKQFLVHWSSHARAGLLDSEHCDVLHLAARDVSAAPWATISRVHEWLGWPRATEEKDGPGRIGLAQPAPHPVELDSFGLAAHEIADAFEGYESTFAELIDAR